METTAKLTRVQWPIGQGCFATEDLQFESGGSLRSIYDCGATKKFGKQLNSAIDEFVSGQSGAIDYLFLSHLHYDHISGIASLLAMLTGGKISVDTVVLPYLDQARALLVLANAAQEGTLNGEFLQFVTNYKDWFAQRGVKSVVMVKPQRPDLSEPPNREPETPSPEGDRTNNQGQQRSRDFAKFAHGATTTSVQLEAGDESIELLGPNGYFFAAVRSFPAWRLVPYVPPIDDTVLEAFCRKLDSEGFDATKDQLSSPKGIAEILTNSERLKALKRCYAEIADASVHNKVSLCLYSGPIDINCTSPEISWFGGCFGRWCEFLELHGCIGWLANGDLPLKARVDVETWEMHYRNELGNCGTVLLPHHGSDNNIDEEFVNAVSPARCLVASDSNSKHHPGLGAVSKLKLASSHVIRVSELPESMHLQRAQLVWRA